MFLFTELYYMRAFSAAKSAAVSCGSPLCVLSVTLPLFSLRVSEDLREKMVPLILRPVSDAYKIARRAVVFVGMHVCTSQGSCRIFYCTSCGCRR